MYSDIIVVLWIAYSYFKEPVFLFLNILVLLVIVFDVIITLIIYALGDSVLGWIIPFLRSSVDNRRIGCNVMDIYYLNFLIMVFLNKVALLSTL